MEIKRSYRSCKHGYANGPTWKSWREMWNRCTNKNREKYPAYGGRGISVCKRWKDFKNFLHDMGERPPEKTLDRINTDGNYEPSNCRWATVQEQCLNRRKKGKGYYWRERRKKYEIRLKRKGIIYHFGTAIDIETARNKAEEAKKRLDG